MLKFLDELLRKLNSFTHLEIIVITISTIIIVRVITGL